MDYKIINSIDDMPELYGYIDAPLFCDIETDGLYGQTRMVQIYQPITDDCIYVIDIGSNKVGYEDRLKAIKNYLLHTYTCWYNSSYDLGTLNISPSLGISNPDEVTEYTEYEEKVFDLFYAVKTAYAEFQDFGLKSIVKKLPYTKGLYEGIDIKENPKGFLIGAYISNNAYKYAALDVYALSLIWEDKRIQNVIHNNFAYRVDMMSQAYALIYQQNGLKLDRDMWKEKLAYSEEEYEAAMAKLPDGFNPNSFKQVRALLNIEKSTHDDLVKIALSESENALLADNIIKAKKFGKQNKYLKSINFDRMYTKFNVAGAVTGRFTSTGGDLDDHFNSQQIPRTLQKLFIQDDDTTRVIDMDYATLELRLIAAMWGVAKMREQFLNDEDLHIAMALAVSGKKVPPPDSEGLDPTHGLYPWGELHDEWLNEQERNDAKAINFGLGFGMSPQSYVNYAFTSYGVKVSLAESEKINKVYFKLYPESKKYHSYCWSHYKSPSFFITTALGRRIKPKLGTDAINGNIQGTGSEVTKLAVHYMVKENPLSLKYIFNVVHDAVYQRVPNKIYEDASESQERCMLKAWTEISKTSAFKYKDIPMKVG